MLISFTFFKKWFWFQLTDPTPLVAEYGILFTMGRGIRHRFSKISGYQEK
ncbi:MAG: hypothetical protein HQL65_03370 [Magnetococcales bacterium]|nr:hypothetical protein [Magnetococcales bacterium]